MDAKKRLEIPDEVVFEHLEGESVLLHLGTGKYFTLNETGSRIWQLIEETGDVASVVDLMQAEYDVEREQLRSDVESLLQDLFERGLVIPA